MSSPPAQGMLHMNIAVNSMTQQAATQQVPATGNMCHTLCSLVLPFTYLYQYSTVMI